MIELHFRCPDSFGCIGEVSIRRSAGYVTYIRYLQARMSRSPCKLGWYFWTSSPPKWAKRVINSIFHLFIQVLMG